MRFYRARRGDKPLPKADANQEEMSVPPRLIFGSSSAAAERPRQSPYAHDCRVRLEPGRALTNEEAPIAG